MNTRKKLSKSMNVLLEIKKLKLKFIFFFLIDFI